MATPHISAEKGDFAKTVLMPGDPLRAKFIAETFLTDAVEVNHTRGILGYTGLYKGKRVSVMASGMGCPWLWTRPSPRRICFGLLSMVRILWCIH